MTKKFSILGKKTPKQDSVPMATGEAKYSVDVMLPGMLHGKVLYSPYPHARIIHIDTTKAERLPGVKAVITGKDTPQIPFRFPWGPPPKDRDSFIFTIDKARYTGDALAAVAAVDEETAEAALDLIEVEYEVLPYINDLEKATLPETVRIHDFAEQNILITREDGYGDIEKGFQEADYVREDTFKFSNTSYMQPEVQGGVVSFDAASGKYTVWAGAVWGYVFRLIFAEMLGVPYPRINVIAPFVGGGFGGKGTWVYPAHLGAAILSKKTGRPVRIVNNRQEDFTHKCGMHQTIITLKAGFNKDGSVIARDATVVYDVGAYGGDAAQGAIYNCCWFHAPYTVSNLKAKLILAYTNNPHHGPFRSYGNVEPVWALELQMDVIAKELGIDPMEIRRINAVQPYTKTPFGWNIQSCGLNECMAKVGDAIGWNKRGDKLAVNRGKGMGSAMNISPRAGAPGNPLTADLIVNSDGTVDLITLGTEGGSGQSCAMRMIVAEELGIPLTDVKKPPVDTDICRETPNWSIITISATGRAPQAAAIDARQKILEVVAGKLEVHVDDLESKDGRVYVKGNQERGMPFAEAARLAIEAKGAIVGKGEYVSTLWEEGGHQHIMSLFHRFGVYGDQAGNGYGVAGAEVELDRETGVVRVLRLANSYDVGFAINPLAVEGQLEGAAAMVLGMAMTEEMPAKDGQLQNPSYLEYKMLTALDMPEVVPIIVESTKETNDQKEGPFGAKELGMGCIASGHAIISAIYDATGVMIKEFPATPERVLKALRAAEQNVSKTKN